MWLFLLFVVVPIVEIGLFIQVGGAIGLWPTVAIVVLTALAGTVLMRAQGIMTLNRLQNSLAEGTNPTDPMAQGAMILVAGVLLLTPGFFTDALGFALLLPPVRVAIMRWASSRITASSVSFSSNTRSENSSRSNGQTINADYSVLDDDDTPPPENPSGWAKH